MCFFPAPPSPVPPCPPAILAASPPLPPRPSARVREGDSGGGGFVAFSFPFPRLAPSLSRPCLRPSPLAHASPTPPPARPCVSAPSARGGAGNGAVPQRFPRHPLLPPPSPSGLLSLRPGCPPPPPRGARPGGPPGGCRPGPRRASRTWTPLRPCAGGSRIRRRICFSKHLEGFRKSGAKSGHPRRKKSGQRNPGKKSGQESGQEIRAEIWAEIRAGIRARIRAKIRARIRRHGGRQGAG